MPSRQRPAQAGFTLVELLVAVALMAIVSLIAWRGLDSITALRERLASNAEQTDSLLAMLGQLERDLTLRAPDVVLQASLGAPLPDDMAAPPRTLPLALSVDVAANDPLASRLEIIRADATRPGAWQRVAWWREGAFLRRAAGAPGFGYPLPEPEHSVVVMTDVQAFTVRGWLPGRGWNALPQEPGANTPMTGLELVIRRRGASNDEVYTRLVNLR